MNELLLNDTITASRKLFLVCLGGGYYTGNLQGTKSLIHLSKILPVLPLETYFFLEKSRHTAP